MEIVVTPKNLAHLKQLVILGANAVIIGNKRFSNRLDCDFTNEEIVSAIEYAHQNKCKVYVSMNAIFHNDILDSALEFMKFLNTTEVDSVLFADYGFYQMYKENQFAFPLTYASDMMATNSFVCNYWHRLGANRIALANELTLDEVIALTEKSTPQIEILGQGLMCMFHSIRPLVDRYLEFTEHSNKEVISTRTDLGLHDQERHLHYPIVQDQQGTHIMSGKEICVVDDLDLLKQSKIHSIRIDGFLQTEEYINAMTKLYVEALTTLEENIEVYKNKRNFFFQQALQITKRPLDKGFFYKPTMYKVK